MWQVEWGAISARIKALVEVGTFFFTTIQAGEHDQGAGGNELIRNGKELVDRLEKFQQNFATQLPEPAVRCLANFVTVGKNAVNSANGIPGVQEVLTLLASYRAEFSYLISDVEAVGRNLAIRAFTHLQRSIVADSEVKKRWAEAFSTGEPACEKLGAVHLLMHGIWAFKASGEGERTDLVLGVPVEISEARAAADTLVLTEWKVVKSQSELAAQAEQAFKQAERYSVGILAGFELSSRRYLVLVSEDFLPLPSPRQKDAVIYECVNVAVSPGPPSKKVPKEKS